MIAECDLLELTFISWIRATVLGSDTIIFIIKTQTECRT